MLSFSYKDIIKYILSEPETRIPVLQEKFMDHRYFLIFRNVNFLLYQLNSLFLRTKCYLTFNLFYKFTESFDPRNIKELQFGPNKIKNYRDFVDIQSVDRIFYNHTATIFKNYEEIRNPSKHFEDMIKNFYPLMISQFNRIKTYGDSEYNMN